ncbi:MAG TPA: sigma-70 family RNA polymerase sigma factor [Stellaceae bacterium]|nr:sigma-70 family RNA polymerase sigma factor [Stellaceae bacterium]
MPPLPRALGDEEENMNLDRRAAGRTWPAASGWTSLPFRGTVCASVAHLDIGAMDDKVTKVSSLEDLLEAVQGGSRAALKRLYELESGRLYGIALRIARRPEIASDALQDAFVQVWQNAAKFTAERGAAAAWLASIVRYRTLDAVRKAGREVLSDDPTLGDRIDEPDILDRLDDARLEGDLKRCLDALDDKQRRCIMLAFVDGFSHSEIAARLAAPLGSVKSWVRRGLHSLRSCLEP